MWRLTPCDAAVSVATRVGLSCFPPDQWLQRSVAGETGEPIPTRTRPSLGLRRCPRALGQWGRGRWLCGRSRAAASLSPRCVRHSHLSTHMPTRTYVECRPEVKLPAWGLRVTSFSDVGCRRGHAARRAARSLSFIRVSHAAIS